MVVLDALGRRGALVEACSSNRGSLNTRLKELPALGLVDHEAAGYVLTEAGWEPVQPLAPLSAWANRGSRNLSD